MITALLMLMCAGGGCSALAVGDQPAVLVASNDEQLATLQQVIAAALAAPAVRLAADAFTNSSTLVIDAAAMRVQGQRLQGLVLSRPDRFQLLRAGAHCVLLHEQTEQRHQLQGVRCRPVAAQPASVP